MTAQAPFFLVVGETDTAMPTLHYITAAMTEQKAGESPAIKKQQRLFTVFHRLRQRSLQGGGENPPIRALPAHVDQPQLRQRPVENAPF